MDNASVTWQCCRTSGIDVSRHRVRQDDMVYVECMDYLSILVASRQVLWASSLRKNGR